MPKCFNFELRGLAERHREAQRSPSDSLHGPRQSLQAVLPDQLHPVCPPPALHRAHQAVPVSGGEPPPPLVNLNAIHLNQHVLLQQHILEPVRHALEYYSEMERTTKEEKRTTKA